MILLPMHQTITIMMMAVNINLNVMLNVNLNIPNGQSALSFIKPGVFPHCISHVLKLTELLCADSRCWMFHCYSMKIKIIILNVEILWKFTSQEEHPMTGQPCYFSIGVELPRGWT